MRREWPSAPRSRADRPSGSPRSNEPQNGPQRDRGDDNPMSGQPDRDSLPSMPDLAAIDRARLPDWWLADWEWACEAFGIPRQYARRVGALVAGHKALPKRPL